MSEERGNITTGKESERNGSLDFWKGIAALSVCFCHIRFPGYAGAVMAAFGTCGVAFFFLISGYALYDPGADKNTICGRILKRFKRNLIITLIAVSVCFIYTLIDRMMYGDVGGFLESLKDPVIYIQMLFPGDFGIISGQPLWFMAALLFAYLIFWLLFFFGLKDKIHYLLLPCTLLCIAGDMTVSTLGLNFHLCSNALAAAFPLMLLGFSINRFKDRIKLRDLSLILTACALALAVILTACLRPGGVDISPLFKMPFSAVMLVICIRQKDRHPSRFFERIGRQDALYFYLVHDLVIDPVIRLYLILAVPSPFFEWTMPFAVLIIALIIAELIGTAVSLVTAGSRSSKQSA